MTEDGHFQRCRDAAFNDANRTLSKQNKGDGYYRVVRMDLQWMRYDPELDDLVPAPTTIRCDA